MQQDAGPAYLIEQVKLSADYLKHLTTLSTGAIILITVFLEKLFTKPRWKSLVVTALGGYMISLITAVVAFTTLLYPLPTSGVAPNVADSAQIVWKFALYFTLLAFLIGSAALTLFAIVNLRTERSSS